MNRTRSLRISLAVAVAVTGLLVQGGASAASCASSDHPGGDWPMMNHDYNNSRHQPSESVIGSVEAATLAPAWTFDANAVSGADNNEITGYPIVADGCVYVASSTGNQEPGYVFALNADTGEPVWTTQLSHGVYSSLAVANGKVYAFVSRVGEDDGDGDIEGPYVVALDQTSGATVWQTTVDHQEGSDAVSSPIVYDGMVWVGVSGTAAEGEEEERFDFRGVSVLLDAETGEMLKHTWTIPDEDLEDGYAGGALWSTIAIDTETGYGYAGTGNPFNYEQEHDQTNAILKIDLDRSRSTFGEIVGSYKGDVEEYFPQVAENFSCDEDDPVGAFFAGFECGRLDVDFGASAQIFRDSNGRKLVGEGQKSGVYHVVDPDTMDPVWKQVVGVPSLVGGIVGTPAYDGEQIITPHTLVGYLTALDKDTGAHNWVGATADGIHWGNPVTSANGVVYTADLKGMLNAWDAQTGAQVLARPLFVGAETGTDPTFTWGGVTVARNTVYTSVGVGLTSAGEDFPSMPNGFVIAFRPSGI